MLPNSLILLCEGILLQFWLRRFFTQSNHIFHQYHNFRQLENKGQKPSRRTKSLAQPSKNLMSTGSCELFSVNTRNAVICLGFCCIFPCFLNLYLLMYCLIVYLQPKYNEGSVAEWLGVGLEIWRSRVQVPLDLFHLLVQLLGCTCI